MASRRRNFHVPLPDYLHDALRKESVRLERPATELARQAIEAWLRERKRLAMFDAIAEYATDSACEGAGKEDLDEELEAAAAVELLALEEEG